MELEKPVYRIEFSDNKKDMWLINVFFVFFGLILSITATNIWSQLFIVIMTLLAYYITCLKISDAWPLSGTLLLYQQARIECHIEQQVIDVKISAHSYQSEHFLALKLLALNHSKWLILKKNSMQLKDYARLRRALVSLNT